ncbi:LysR family transcriptional regulator [Paracoccus benzoatiresistens]|uniref:LysR family transcriptional regulator n=1 Tax=Paracoccus benzoatiresistens TaxID=2997341 RepID=A0ABT4JC72_9RHOB|nr:LysR family transcriptional regulator [Paracoccus sp. EF6]MCZ0964167.1 LysR family transcriptional regulator [Paracoccus sp. EF6]
MDLVDGMRVFVAAVETGSFSGAAARLGISPKLASKYMAALEARMGTQLLYRTTRRLGLSPAGERLMAQAPAWLDQLEEMAADMREAQRGLSGTIRVSAAVTHGELLLAQLLRRFRSAHPDLVIDLRLSDHFVDLAAGGIDLAVRIGQLDDSSLVARRIGSMSLLLVASPGYLEARGHPAAPEDLGHHDCIRDTNMRGDGTWALTNATAEQRVRVTGHFLVNSARSARDLAMMDEGIALCPDYLVQDDIRRGRLERVLPHFSGPQRDIHAVYLRQHRIPRRTRTLLDFLVQALGSIEAEKRRET